MNGLVINMNINQLGNGTHHILLYTSPENNIKTFSIPWFKVIFPWFKIIFPYTKLILLNKTWKSNQGVGILTLTWFLQPTLDFTVRLAYLLCSGFDFFFVSFFHSSQLIHAGKGLSFVICWYGIVWGTGLAYIEKRGFWVFFLRMSLSPLEGLLISLV